MQVIATRYIGPSNTKPSRIVAEASGGARIMRSYPHDATNNEAAHAQIARELVIQLGWSRLYLAGQTKDGFVFAFPPDDRAIWVQA